MQRLLFVAVCVSAAGLVGCGGDGSGDSGSAGTAGVGGNSGTGGTGAASGSECFYGDNPLDICTFARSGVWYGFPEPGVVVCFNVGGNNHELAVPESDPNKLDDCDLGWGNGLLTYAIFDGPLTGEPACHFEFPGDSPSAPDVLPLTARPSPDDDGSVPLGLAGTTPLVTLDRYQDDFISLEMDFGQRDPNEAHRFGTAFASSGPLNDCELPTSAAAGFRVWAYHPFPLSTIGEEAPEWINTASDTIRVAEQPDWLLRFLDEYPAIDDCEYAATRGLSCSVEECVACRLDENSGCVNEAFSGACPQNN